MKILFLPVTSERGGGSTLVEVPRHLHVVRERTEVSLEPSEEIELDPAVPETEPYSMSVDVFGLVK